ncbi:MAG: hypothetical protein EPN73_17905 [Paraburkholderia sp.]|uniref:hypothetical protein n=1 Tax=Paraburkholderia sp. TaxID=1926495 RepID=UPI0012253E87|nr:hypothetical protein [Paraburkholderia sp.]TAL94236.1 MAG: hypothetical protein EPN73_17905 [Paraburkholderia sp.]
MKPARFLSVAICVVSSICFGAAQSNSPEKNGIHDIVEVEQTDLKGTVGNHSIVLRLLRTGDRFNGYYRYVKQRPSEDTNRSAQYDSSKLGDPIWLTGHLDSKNGRIKLIETRDQAPPNYGAKGNVTGTWDVALDRDSLEGTWSQHSRILTIHTTRDKAVPTLPFEMKVRVQSPIGFAGLDDRNHDATCDADQNNSSDAYSIDEIYLYRNGQLAQTIKGFKAGGVCTPSFPRVRDVEFDGQPAIVLATAPGISAQHYYLLWTYDAGHDSFVANNAWDVVLTGWDDPIIDPETRTLSVCWWSSGSWPFGSRTYRWQKSRLQEVGHNECGDPDGGQKCKQLGKGPSYRMLCQIGTASEPVSW